MKISAFNILSLFAATVGVADSSSIVGAGGQYTPVSITLSCKGVNWNGLTVSEDDYSATVLMESYNAVHQELDAGDYYMANVHFEGVRMMGLKDSADMADVLESVDVDDEDTTLERKIKPVNSPHYNGGWSCNYCRPDYEAVAAMFVDFLSGAKGKSLVAWEKKFEAMLKEGPHSALHGANKCNIVMTKTQQDDNDTDAVAVADAVTVTAPALRGFTTTVQY